MASVEVMGLGEVEKPVNFRAMARITEFTIRNHAYRKIPKSEGKKEETEALELGFNSDALDRSIDFTLNSRIGVFELQAMATPATAKRKPVFVKVDQLKPGTNGHTLTVKVISSKPVKTTVNNKGVRSSMVLARPARPSLIAECLVGDETGSIIFTARNEQGMLYVSIFDQYCIISLDCVILCYVLRSSVDWSQSLYWEFSNCPELFSN